MIPGDLAIFFVIGLLGGAHCIGMCGPLVTLYAGRLEEKTESRRGHLSVYEVRQHALFNIGRTVGYATIGGLLGLVGGLFFSSTTQIPFADTVRGSVGIVIGTLVVAIGIYYLLGQTGFDSGIPSLGFKRIYGVLTNYVDRLVGGPGIIALGAIHGLLPCPILYPAFLFAFVTGSALYGALALATLGVGTIPAVFLYGTVVEAVSPTHRKHLHRVLGVTFIVLGYIPLSHGLMLFDIHLPHLIELPFYQPLEGGGHGG